MGDALRALWRGLVIFERFGWVFVIANLLAAFCSLLVITAPAAFAGLSRLAHTAQTSPTVALDDFWSGFRAHLRRGIVIGLANVVILGMLWVNFTAFSAQQGMFFTLLRFMWLIILVVWLAAQLYFWPILEAMERPDVRLGLFNAALMMLHNPFFSLIILLGVALIALVSTLLVVPWTLITASLIACIANAAVLDRLSRFRAG